MKSTINNRSGGIGDLIAGSAWNNGQTGFGNRA